MIPILLLRHTRNTGTPRPLAFAKFLIRSAARLVPLALLLAGCHLPAADADATPEQVIVPLHDPSKPSTIHVHMLMGGITIRGEDRKDIAVESSPRFREDREVRSARADGLKRLDLGSSRGLDIKEENNVVTVKTDIMRLGGDLLILVPRKTSLQIKCLSGGVIEVQNVEGEIDVENLNGAIKLMDVAGSVVAHSLNGAVTADLQSVDPAKPMSFSTLNGNIDVTLPPTVKAKVSMKTDNGEILSDFDVKLDTTPPKAMPPDAGLQPDGTFHVHIDKTLHGTINGGGPEYQFRSFNGQIFIRKKK
jgi:hypothetical protein